jgi:hypothetical protein
MSAYFNHHYISNSDLKRLRKMIDPKFQDPADLEEIFAFGTLVHALIFEPHKADREHKDYGLAMDMAKAFMNHQLCRQILHVHDLRREHEFYRSDVFGVPARCKADAESRELDMIFEYKGLGVTNEKAFEDAISRFDYDQAVPWYMDVGRRKRYLLVSGSKKAPKRLFIRLVDRNHQYYHQGLEKVYKAIKLFLETFPEYKREAA